VAVAVIMPTPRPVTNRAISSPGRSGQARNSTAAAASRPSAGSSTRLRPTQSEMWPARIRLVTTPTAYTAKTTVTVNGVKPSRCW
jgi:hypothetical protein